MKPYTWKPIEAPDDPDALARPELQALAALWAEQRARLQKSGADKRFMERLIRRWSIETGIVERLYELSDGATQLLVQQGFDAALLTHGDTDLAPDELIRVLSDHREAIDFAMDIVGRTRELSAGWIKELHALLTRHQETTRAMLPDGRMVNVPLLRGEFKQTPNNPSDSRTGVTHEYCPPEHVDSEMDRLVEIYGQLPDIPEVRSAWLHHAFAQIHPFQDGNGRVARVLASLDFLRSGLFPLLVLRTERTEYIDALRAADDGDMCPLVDFFTDAQKRMLIRGLSEADQATANITSLDTVLFAACEKLRIREETALDGKRAMVGRMERYAELAQKTLRARGDVIAQGAPSVVVDAHRSSSRDQHRWYRKQIIQIAGRHDYWADLHETRRWARLELRNGGRTELVVVLHFVGNPTSGGAVAVAFVDHREQGETLGERPPVDTAAEPLLLAPKEDAGMQEKRFLDWLERAIVQGLAIWVRYL